MSTIRRHVFHCGFVLYTLFFSTLENKRGKKRGEAKERAGKEAAKRGREEETQRGRETKAEGGRKAEETL